MTEAQDYDAKVAAALQSIADCREMLAEEPPVLREMIELCARHVVNIESNQRGWIVGGLYTAPDPRMVRDAMVFDAIHKLLKTIDERPFKAIDYIRADVERREAAKQAAKNKATGAA